MSIHRFDSFGERVNEGQINESAKPTLKLAEYDSGKFQYRGVFPIDQTDEEIKYQFRLALEADGYDPSYAEDGVNIIELNPGDLYRDYQKIQ